MARRAPSRNSSFQDGDVQPSSAAAAATAAAANEGEKPKKPVTLKSVLIRTGVGALMSIFVLTMLQAGHFYCILIGALTQAELYRELVNVRYVKAKEEEMPWFRSTQWAWFFAAMLYVYGETLHHFCKEHPTQLASLLLVTETILNSAFFVYCFLFVASVLTLKANLVRFQISQYMWSIVTICLTVFQCKFFAQNILNGLFWFFFPMATVVMNDVSAYFCGITMGKKFITAPFIPLSPNKTWEGFLGAAVLTLIFSFFFPLLLSNWTWFTCKAETIELAPQFYSKALECVPNPVFVARDYPYDVPFAGNGVVKLLPIQIHGLSYGLFASVVAPFGGFFASAIKRAYDLKDFDSFMPGHGGMMDRMDCQLLMMAFTAFHYNMYVAPFEPKNTTAQIDNFVALFSSMAFAQQDELIRKLTGIHQPATSTEMLRLGANAAAEAVAAAPSVVEEVVVAANSY